MPAFRVLQSLTKPSEILGVYPKVKPGYCACGCGNLVKLVSGTNTRLGIRKGEPNLFLHGHAARKVRFFEGVPIPPTVIMTSNGKTKAPWYNAWRSMKSRCYNRKDMHYKIYGARGIRVCLRWKRNSAAFYKDMGPPPTGMVLDRRDNNGDYTPGNCHWTTPAESAHNRRTNVMNWEIVKEIRRRAKKQRTFEIARDMKMDYERVRSVVKNYRWKELPGVARA
jgi:hypothetical protein